MEVVEVDLKPNPYRFSPEQVKSTKAILKAFRDGASQSTAGRLDFGKNKLLVQHFLDESKRLLKYSKEARDHNNSNQSMEYRRLSQRTGLENGSSTSNLGTYKNGDM